MADAATVTMRRGLDEEGTELLLVESGERERDRERSWRLNFDGLRLSERREEPPPRRLHDCLGALGSFFPFFLSPYNTLGFDVLFLLHIYTYVNIIWRKIKVNQNKRIFWNKAGKQEGDQGNIERSY